MNVAEKLEPLVALKSDPPAYINDVRFDDGADGDTWVYLNAHHDPGRREKQRWICVVARSDKAIAAELAVLEHELAAWTEAAKAEAKEFVQRGLDRLLEQRTSATNAHAQAVESATIQANRARELEAKVDNLRANIEPLRSEEEATVRAQVALLDLELDRMAETRDAQRRVAGEHNDRALELGSAVENTKQLVTRAEAEFEADVAARFNKRVAPLATTDRIAELQAELGRVSVHASEHSHKHLVEPGAITEFVGTHADWMRGAIGRCPI